MIPALLLEVLLLSPAAVSDSEQIEQAFRGAMKELAAAPAARRPAIASTWAEALVNLPLASASAKAGARAEALHLLIHAGQIDLLFSRAAALSPSDPIWERLPGVLLEASEQQNDYTQLIRLSEAIGNEAPDPAIRAQALLAGGEALSRAGRAREARSAFDLVAKTAPSSGAARAAAHRLTELITLSPGTPAPDYSIAAAGGPTITRASTRGKVVLLDFWASWCAACTAQFALFRELHDTFGEKGLVIVSASLDKDCEAADASTRRAGITWPAVCDSRGEEGALAKDFAVTGVPATYLIDRAGSIAGKDLPSGALRAAVGELLAEPRVGRFASEARRASQSRIPDVFRALGIQPGSRVADIGAGEGFFTLRLAAAVGPQGRVIAVDIDERALGKLQRRLAPAGVSNVRIVVSQPADPLLATGSLDAALMVQTYHEIAAHQGVLAKVRAALRPGGRLVLIDTQPEDRARPRQWQFEHHQLALELVAGDLAQAGFRVLDRQEAFLHREANERAWLIVAEP